ncbi:MAG: hypothetical protein PWQ55_1318 [Chloroflexota bacterium]|nr:hypothetical protein [Chloroflexota bacterium]
MSDTKVNPAHCQSRMTDQQEWNHNNKIGHLPKSGISPIQELSQGEEDLQLGSAQIRI